MKPLLPILALVAVAGGVFTLGNLKSGDNDKSLLHVADELPITVKVATPLRQSIIRLVQAPGDVEAVLEVEISSEIVAKIEKMPIEEGDSVEMGDLLCQLNDDNLRAEVHLILETGQPDPVKVTYDWSDASGEHVESHVFDRNGEWQLATGRHVRTRWVEFEPIP